MLVGVMNSGQIWVLLPALPWCAVSGGQGLRVDVEQMIDQLMVPLLRPAAD